MSAPRRHTLAGVVALVAGLAAAGGAAAAPPNPVQGVSAIDQYIEAVPTSSGPAPTGGARGTQPKRATLPTQVVSSLRSSAGTDAETLIEIATSPAYGAPPTAAAGGGDDAAPAAPVTPAAPTTPTTPARDPEESSGVTESSPPSPLDAVVTPIADADDSRLLVLLALVSAITIAAFGLAVRSSGTRRL